MPTRNLKVDNAFTGDSYTDTVTAPTNGGDTFYGIGQLSAPVSALNIYDIEVWIEVFEEGRNGEAAAWRVRDYSFFKRDLVTGPLEPVNCAFSVYLPRLAGKDVRGRVSCGQSVLALSLSVKW